MKIGNIDELSVKRVKKFCKKVFNVMDGRINPIFPARKIKFIRSADVELEIVPEKDQSTFAYQCGDCIFVAHEEIYKFLRRNIDDIGNTEVFIKGFILCLISHELGHMDQQFLSKGYEDYPRRGSIESEIANEYFILDYIDTYYHIIRDYIGTFSIKLYIETSVYLDNNDVDKEKCIYGKISSVREIAIKLLISVLQIDLLGITSDVKYKKIKLLKIISMKNNRKYENIMVFDINNIFFENLNDMTLNNIKDMISFLTDEFLYGYVADLYFDVRKLNANDYELLVFVDTYSKKFNSIDGDCTGFKVDSIYRRDNKDKEMVRYIENMIDLYANPNFEKAKK